MNLCRLLILSIACPLLLTACSKSEPRATPTPPARTDLLSPPTEAQPRLATLQLYLGAEVLSAEIARRPREIMTGMMFRTNITESDAMLFVLPRPTQTAFWMKNCPEPLSCAYINPSGIIEEIHPMEPYNTNTIMAASSNILFVLETKHGWFDRHHIRTGMLVQTEHGPLLSTFFQNPPE